MRFPAGPEAILASTLRHKAEEVEPSPAFSFQGMALIGAGGCGGTFSQLEAWISEGVSW